jgi:hypothetical protein
MANYINNATILSGLVAYRDELSTKEILHESVFSARTLGIVNRQYGVKGTQTINLITSQPVFQLAQCGLLSGTGSVTFAQRDITVNDLMIQEDICYVGSGTLTKYFTGMSMNKGIKQEDITPEIFAKAYMSDKMLKIGDYVEKSIWLGSTSGTVYNAAYTLTNGFLYQLYQTSASQSIVSGNGTYSGALTVANAINVMNGIVNAIPEAIADKQLYAFMSLANYRTLCQALITTNNYHFTAIDSSIYTAWEISYPFLPTLTIVATSGLTGRNDIILSTAENFYVGVDGEHDDETFDVWDSKDLNSVRFRAMWRLGTQVAYPQYIVAYQG